MSTYTERAIGYAVGVVEGEIVACELVHQACRRFLGDLERQGAEGFPFRLDADRADAVCGFIEQLKHVKGKWARTGESIRLEDWQCFLVVGLFGWLNVNTGLRRFRSAYVEVARKNAKSTLAAAIGLVMLVFDNEYGPEVYSGATTEAQAWEVFRPARMMLARDELLANSYGVKINAKSMVTPEDGGRFQPVIGNPGDGASPSCAIVDEYHEHRTSDLRDTMQTGMAAREQPLIFVITTAGVDTGGPCFEARQDAIDILKGAAVDESVFALIYTIDEDDQWDTIDAQKKANPNYGVSVDPEFLEGQLIQARRSASRQNAYKTKHLNLWVGAKTAWLNMLAYQACRRKALNLEDFRGQRCVIGLDLASKVDIASMAIVFRDENERFTVFCRHYLPENRINEGGSTRYKSFHAGGWITTTPGDVLDYGQIAEDLDDLKSDYQIDSVAYDPFQATQFSVERQNEGYPMVEIGATVKNFSEPMKYLEAVILQQAIRFELDPCLMWMFGNVVATLDKKDNIFPNKERGDNKIDGVVAIIMAMNRWLLHRPTRSIYEDKDLVTA
jgi:phage terminase large subunit-like protein